MTNSIPGDRSPSRIDVVGLGPAGPELITAGTLALMANADAVFLRTSHHPSASAIPSASSFDYHYERAETFDQVYRDIVDDLVSAALDPGLAADGSPPVQPTSVVYAVPGSPTVAERTVSLLRDHPAVVGGEVTLVIHPSVSFLDLAFARLGVDPVGVGVTVVDGPSFAVEAAGLHGPLLVAQCWSSSVLSDIKLSVDPEPGAVVVVLHHLGLEDEQVVELAWDEMDRSLEPDHLTSLWIPHLGTPVASRLVELDELVHILREQCPWDREQTHGSLARHLLEESYEVLEAIDDLAAIDAFDEAGGTAVRPGEEEAVAHLEEELGDLLFQVYFHATLAAEAGRFTLADVAAGVHDKLVSRHPHVFEGVVADTPDQVATNWEALKKAEKNRSSVTEGIPAALPALALAAKLQRKGLAVGMVLPDLEEESTRMADGVGALRLTDTDPTEQVGELLFALVNVARSLGVDPETALRARANRFRSSVEEHG